MRQLLFFFSLIILSCSCIQPGWMRNKNIVTIGLNPDNSGEARLMKLEVLDDDIIHVLVSPDNRFSMEKSLCVSGTDKMKPDFKVRQLIDTLVLTTSKIRV